MILRTIQNLILENRRIMRSICYIGFLCLLCLTFTVFGQTKNGYLEIEIGDAAKPFLSTTISNPYFDPYIPLIDTLKFSRNNDVIQDNTDYPTSFITKFLYKTAPPLFRKDYPERFSKWIVNNLIADLHKLKEYNYDITFTFTVTDNGTVKDVITQTDSHFSDETSIKSILLKYIECSNSDWEPAKFCRINYNTPIYLHIRMQNFIPIFRNKTIIHEYQCKHWEQTVSDMYADGPWTKNISDSLVVNADKVDNVAKCSENINEWIKNVVQDKPVFVGYKFHNGHTRIEAIISQRGWVYSAKVIESDDEWLGEWLAENMLRSPRWIPAKIGGKAVASRIMVDYDWTFDD